MGPNYSVTFTIEGEHFSVPFLTELAASAYASAMDLRFQGAEVTNIVVNDLVS
jgi:hypothetical protein